MAKLTKQQWQEARAKWESDPREGYDWLAIELGGVVSRQGISKTANKQGWRKAWDDKKVADKVAQPKKESCATKKSSGKVAQPKAKELTVKQPETADEDLGGAQELISALHGNSHYKQEYNEQVFKLCLLGATDADIADFFNVTEQTINNWKLAYPEFFESLNAGKKQADTEVAHSLYKAATGQHFVSEDRLVGDGNGGQEVVTLKKQIDPQVTAMRYWLNNRQRKLWREKVEVEQEINVRVIPWDELRQISEESFAKAKERHRSVIEGRAERLGITLDSVSDQIDVD